MDGPVGPTIWINAAPDRVWRAVTDPAQLVQWYAPGSPWEIPNLRDGEPATFHLMPNAHNPQSMRLQATIDVVDPPHLFVLRWEPWEGTETTYVQTILLEAENGGTRVTMTIVEADAAPNAEPEVNEGYVMSLENLKALLEGRSLPH